MSDLYHIPNDDGKTYRLKKFVEYQHEVPETHYRFVAEYCKRHSLTQEEIVNMAFLMSSTYSEISTVFLYELLKKYTYEELWRKYRDDLNFGSARKHMKLKDRFLILSEDWRYFTGDDFFGYIQKHECGDPLRTYSRIQKSLMGLNEVGRFASELFLELIVFMRDELEINIKQPVRLNWKESANLTSGVYNIFYEDEKAFKYEKNRSVSAQEGEYLTSRLRLIQREIQDTYPTQNSEINMFLGKVCSFRNLFKAARYGGFHHDRQLGVLNSYRSRFPDYEYLWKECFDIRKAIYPIHLLGEYGGWDGIRKERKKIWLMTGKTGVEHE